MTKNRILSIVLALSLAVCVMLNLCVGAVAVSDNTYSEQRIDDSLNTRSKRDYYQEEAAEGEIGLYGARAIQKELSLVKIKNKSIYAYTRQTVYVRGSALSVKGIKIEGIDYIPLRIAASAVGATYNYNSKTKSAVLSLYGFTMSVTDGNYVIYANERPLFAMSPAVIMSDGRLYIPTESFAFALGMSYRNTGGSQSIDGAVKPISIKKGYSEDEVFWLARIIHAESQGESLLGKIAVGNVVLNRVRSKQYPNTIYGVIFDKKYGVQFSPILNGTIYNTPSYQSRLAAMICLEGFSLDDGVLFFLRPELSSSSWIPNTRDYLFSIGSHDFYK